MKHGKGLSLDRLVHVRVPMPREGWHRNEAVFRGEKQRSSRGRKKSRLLVSSYLSSWSRRFTRDVTTAERFR